MKRSFSLLVIFLSLWALASCQEKAKQAAVVVPGVDSMPANIRAITEKIKSEPENPEFFNERAMLYLERQEGNMAFSDASKAIALRSGVAKYYITFSDACLLLNKVKECRTALEKAIELDKQSPDAYNKMAELSLYFKDYTKVFMYTAQALEVDPLNAKANFIRGFAQKEKGDTVAAIKSFKQTVDADQKNYDAYIQLGLLYAAKKNKLAADYYNTALKLRTNSIEALYNLGVFYQETGAYNEAMDAYRKIIAINPRYKFAHFNLGYIHLFYLKVFNQGVRHFTDAITADPAYAEAYYNRGYCYELMGDEINARQDYKKSLELRPAYTLPQSGLQRLDQRNADFGNPKK